MQQSAAVTVGIKSERIKQRFVVDVRRTNVLAAPSGWTVKHFNVFFVFWLQNIASVLVTAQIRESICFLWQVATLKD